MLSTVWSKGSKRNKTATWAKVKFDHQVVAIAKTNAADVVYSDDSDVQAMCRRERLKVQGVWDLPPPPVNPQMDMFGKDSKPSDQ